MNLVNPFLGDPTMIDRIPVLFIVVLPVGVERQREKTANLTGSDLSTILLRQICRESVLSNE
jgi:hypothetical protein